MLRCSVSKSDLLVPLSLIQGVVDKKTIMSLLKNVYLRTEGRDLILEGTDLERSIRCRVTCDVKEEGGITVSAKQLFEIIKEFPSENIDLSEDDDMWLNIGGSENAKYKLGCVSPEDFPKFREIATDCSVTMDSNQLKRMIEKTIYAASSNDNDQFGLSGMLIELINSDEGSTIRSVCTNGHRLSLLDQSVDSQGIDQFTMLIPKKSAMEIRRVAETLEGEFLFGIDDKYAFMVNDGTQLIIRLMENNYPDYRRIIPESRESHVILEKHSFYNALKRITIVTSDGLDTRGVTAQFSDGFVQLKPLQKETGDAMERVPVDMKVEEDIFLAFNVRYMMEAIAVMESDKVNFSYSSSNAPCFLWGEEDPGYLAFIMPLKIN